ncbi:MAG: RNase adapter RapZ [Armatimonadota bacterium]|nr:RNase adapter RapZ [Armatimonadota bacterium]
MQFVIITGISGAGKALAAKTFEDMAFTVVDNVPPVLLPELVAQSQGVVSRLAAVVDARAGTFFAGLDPALKTLGAQGVKPTVLFLDATDEVLVQRFKETRRKHPLFNEQGGILESIERERSLLETLKEDADKVIDTSDLSANGLRGLLLAEFAEETDKNQGLTITVTSFGFKYGLPLDADLVFDVRFLVNPYYVDDLRPCDGRDARVEKYVMRDPDTGLFLTKLYDLMDWSVPQYIKEGKAYLTVAIGCTGGRHRSVMVGEKLGAHLREQGYRVLVQHRDVGKTRT